MLTVTTDFQAIEADGACWILRYNGVDLDKIAREQGICQGDRVILDAFEDFEVVGTLDFKFVAALNRDGWVAYPDWSTRTECGSTEHLSTTTRARA
jgi:hypothetical protein